MEQKLLQVKKAQQKEFVLIERESLLELKDLKNMWEVIQYTQIGLSFCRNFCGRPCGKGFSSEYSCELMQKFRKLTVPSDRKDSEV